MLKYKCMKESYLYKKIKGDLVQCQTCNHFCSLKPDQRGKCGVRENKNGKLFALNYGKAIAVNIDPIEKKPFFHFLPGSHSFSIATSGCNLRCDFCQNWDISQGPKPCTKASLVQGKGKVQNSPILGENLPPEEIVKQAKKTGCQSIAYTYTEPAIFLEYALDTMKLAYKTQTQTADSDCRLKNVWVTNGFFSEKTLKLISPYLDAANVDLKSFSENYYDKICGARLKPVLENLKSMKKLKIWLEVTTLIVPGYNDSDKELKQIASFIASELGKETPWHISRFFPAYKMSDVPPTPTSTIHKAYNIGKKTGLLYVYAGNIPGNNIDGIATESTYCPKCKKLVLGRFGFNIETNNLTKDAKPRTVHQRRIGAWGKCKHCGKKIDIITK